MLITDVKQRLIRSVVSAFRPAMRSAWWLLKMMIPVTLLVAVLNYLGIVEAISEFAAPLFNLMGLDGKAALVFITSVMANIYSAIGVIASLGLDYRSVVILATMCLIAHNMIVEVTIQKKTGASLIGIIALRLLSALAAGYLLNKILPGSISGTLLLNVSEVPPTSWQSLFLAWFQTTGVLCLQIVVVISALNILQNILREFKILDMLTLPLRPLMRVMGLPAPVTFLWIVANTLGLAYGGMVIIEESRSGRLDKRDIALLNTSIAQTHSLLEDTFLFVSIGVGLWWTIIPRFVFSIVTVWAQRAIRIVVQILSHHRAVGMVK